MIKAKKLSLLCLRILSVPRILVHVGKTIQVAEYCNQTTPDNVLIVYPASLRINWEKELDRWLNRDAVAFTCIRSYEQIVADNYPDVAFNLIVFDEAHYLKNPTAKRTKAEVLNELPAKIRQVIELDIPDMESAGANCRNSSARFKRYRRSQRDDPLRERNAQSGTLDNRFQH